MENIEVETQSSDDLRIIIDRARRELDRRDVLEEAKSDADRAAERYAEAVQGEPARDWSPGDVAGPGDRVIEGGVEYINVSQSWLPVPPSQYPIGYELAEEQDGGQV